MDVNQRAFEKASVEFTNDDQPGVRIEKEGKEIEMSGGDIRDLFALLAQASDDDEATKPSDDGMKYLLEECPDDHKHMGGLCSMMLDAWQTRADVQKKVCVDKLIADMIKELQ